jgi:hypothetical protein
MEGRSECSRFWMVTNRTREAPLLPEQSNIHSAYFEEPRTLELMRRLLRGLDRSIVANAFNVITSVKR